MYAWIHVHIRVGTPLNVCMHVRMHACMYVHAHVCTYVRIYIYIYVYAFMRACNRWACIYVCSCACRYSCFHVFTHWYMFGCMYVSICPCVYLCTYACLHVGRMYTSKARIWSVQGVFRPFDVTIFVHVTVDDIILALLIQKSCIAIHIPSLSEVVVCETPKATCLSPEIIRSNQYTWTKYH